MIYSIYFIYYGSNKYFTIKKSHNGKLSVTSPSVNNWKYRVMRTIFLKSLLEIGLRLLLLIAVHLRMVGLRLHPHSFCRIIMVCIHHLLRMMMGNMLLWSQSESLPFKLLFDKINYEDAHHLMLNKLISLMRTMVLVLLMLLMLLMLLLLLHLLLYLLLEHLLLLLLLLELNFKNIKLLNNFSYLQKSNQYHQICQIIHSV